MYAYVQCLSRWAVWCGPLWLSMCLSRLSVGVTTGNSSTSLKAFLHAKLQHKRVLLHIQHYSLHEACSACMVYCCLCSKILQLYAGELIQTDAVLARYANGCPNTAVLLLHYCTVLQSQCHLQPRCIFWSLACTVSADFYFKPHLYVSMS